MHGFTLRLVFYLLLLSFLLQTDAPRGASQCTPADRHRKRTHQSVHHDPVAAPTGGPPERPSAGLRHQVGRCSFEFVVLIFATSAVSLSRFCLSSAHCNQPQNNWCQLKASSPFICCHLPFCNNFISFLPFR